MRKTPLKRKTPLRSKTGLKRTPFKTQGGTEGKPLTTRKPLKSKPRKVTAEETRARKLIAQRSDGVCEICGYRPATDAAHRLPRSAGGAWAAGNLLHACRHCHDYNHAHPLEAFDTGQHVRRGSDPLETAVYLRSTTYGVGWFILNDNGEVHPQ